MVRKSFFLTTLIVCLAPLLSYAADQQDFSRRIGNLYGFSPHALNDRQIASKSQDLDRFWTMVRREPRKYLPLLRKELAEKGDPAFFYYDGSKLLLSLSSEDGDRRIALKAIARCDLRDVQHADYLLTVHSLAIRGFDTSEAAFHILSDPRFTAAFPRHALTLGQDYSFILMLLPTREKFYVPKAIARIREETDPAAVKSLLRLLWYVDTAAADSAIQWASQESRLPEEIRKEAGEMRQGREQLRTELPAARKADLYEAARVPPSASYESLKKTRKERLRSLSDEALVELDQITILMKLKGQ